MNIGELAQRSQVNLETIRYYERRGLLAEPPRSRSGYRQYSPDDEKRVRFIKQAQELGFSLREIGELLELRVAEGVTCADVRQRAQAKVEDVEQKIAGLLAIRKRLLQITGMCAGMGPVDACPILESFESERKGGDN